MTPMVWLSGSVYLAQHAHLFMGILRASLTPHLWVCRQLHQQTLEVLTLQLQPWNLKDVQSGIRPALFSWNLTESRMIIHTFKLETVASEMINDHQLVPGDGMTKPTAIHNLVEPWQWQQCTQLTSFGKAGHALENEIMPAKAHPHLQIGCTYSLGKCAV